MEQIQSNTVTFDQVLMLINENSKQLKETKELLAKSSLETDKMFQETNRKFQETKELLAKSSLETDRMFQETTKQMNRLQKKMGESESRWGKFVESLVEGKLVSLLKKRGIKVEQTFTRVRSEKQDMEIDIIAANGEDVVVVEVKTTLNFEKVNEFIEKLGKFKETFKRFNENNVIGAVAYINSDEGSIKFANKNGLYVIRATGEGAQIINEKNFKPKHW